MALNPNADVFTAPGVGQQLMVSDGLANLSIELTGNGATMSFTLIGYNSTAGQTAAFPVALYLASTPGTILAGVFTTNGLYRTYDASAYDRLQLKCTAIASGTATVVYATSNVGGGP